MVSSDSQCAMNVRERFLAVFYNSYIYTLTSIFTYKMPGIELKFSYIIHILRIKNVSGNYVRFY